MQSTKSQEQFFTDLERTFRASHEKKKKAKIKQNKKQKTMPR